jgi:hypothetical protein
MSYTQTTVVYTAIGTGSQYIDLTKGLSLVNAKNCSQFRKDKPLILSGTIRMESDNERVQTAKNSWVVRNAAVKAGAAWKRTLRSAGIRNKGKLNTYAREMRLALDMTHAKTYGGSLGSSGTAVDAIPQDVTSSYATGVYEAGTGTEIEVYATLDLSASAFSATKKRSFTQTTFAVPQSGATDVLDKPANLIGAIDSVYSNVVSEYIDSRINDADIEDTDMDATPTIDNDFVMMLAPGEEVADDVLDNVDDEGKWRPYDLLSHSTKFTDVVTGGCNVAGQDTFFDAPLGLLKWSPSANLRQIVINVSAISEM